MKPKITILSLALTLAWSGVLLAQVAAPANKAAKSSEAPAPAGAVTVDQILDKNIQAIGGQAAMKKITSRTIKGTIEIPAMNATFPFEQENKAPNKRLTKMEISGLGTILDGFDGEKSWTKNQEGAVQEKKGEELARLKRECEFYHDLKFKDLYPKMSVAEKQKLGDREAYVLEAKPAVGGGEKFYFDSQSGLLVRWDSSFENESGKTSLKITYSDHREVDGLKMPFSQTVEVSGPNALEMTVVVKCTEMRHNVPLEDAKFQKPAE